jgi:putative transposase
MKQATGLKIRLRVDEENAQILDGQSKICNWLYNQLLEKANTLRAEFIASGGKDGQVALILYSKYGLRDLIPAMKRESPFLKSVYSSPLKNAALRLSRAIREYQKSRRQERHGRGAAWPRFRSWKRKWFSLLYDQPWTGFRLQGRQLILSLGVDRDGKRLKLALDLVEPLPFPQNRVKSLRIVKEAGSFYAVFVVERTLPEPRSGRRIVALDPNHKNLAYGVGTDGRALEIENCSQLKALDRRIDELKSRRDRCKRQARLVCFAYEDGTLHQHWQPSRRWQRLNRALEKLYRQRREQTKTYLYTVANALCREYDVIAVGDYTPRGGGINRGMRRALNNQSLIGRFKQVMAWVAQKSGKIYLEYNERGTTRGCCHCATVIPGGLSPEVRAWTCAACGSFHIRDENAAQNGLMVVKRMLLSGSDHRPVEIQARCTWRVTPTGVYALPGGMTVCEGNRQEELNQERGSS